MKWDAPASLLAVFIVAAGLCLFGGARFAREDFEVRQERSRDSHREFVKRLDQELDRLETLYQSHLRRLSSIRDPGNTRAIQDLGNKTVGVLQFSLLSKSATSRANSHLPMNAGADLPVPAFSEVALPLGSRAAILDPMTILDQPVKEGWIDEPGKPLFYWHQREDQRVVAILVDPKMVAQAMNTWLEDWLPKAFDAIAVQDGADRLEAPNGEHLASTGTGEMAESERPHFLLPLPTRFGTWQLASWDATELVTRYRWPVLVTGLALAITFLGLGLLVFFYQRRAVRLAQTRVSFVNQVSHELRSPLTNILLNADLVGDALEDQHPSSRNRLRLIQEEAHRLGRLIANVLTFSRWESGRQQLEWAPTAMDEVVDEVLEQFATSLERLQVEVDHQRGASTPVLMDHDAVFQIVANLVSNVEKCAAEGGLLEIRTAIKGARLSLEVADRGPGIAAKDECRAFESFERLHQHVHEGASGTGLGLAIARGLAEDLGGSLTLEPSSEGARFELSLPVAPAGGGPDVVMKVVIADDDPITLEAVEACLTAEGFASLTARDGKEALELYQKHRPSLVCLDIMMPKMDGFEVCRQIRKEDSTTPILFLSAKNEEIDVVVGLELGADDFVRKPFGKRELLARVRAALRRQTALSSEPAKSFPFGDLTIYPQELRAEKPGGEEINLSPREVALLTVFHAHRGEAVHRDKLLDECWGMDYYPESRTLDQHIAKLRKKVEPDVTEPTLIETVRGVGYRYRR